MEKGRVMGKFRKAMLVTVALMVIAAAGALFAACGSSSSPSSSASSSTSATTSATAAMTKILGHAPTGLAATIAKRGYFVAVDDPNYPPQSYIDKNGNLIGFDVDVAKQVAKEIGVPVKVVDAVWSSVPTGVQVDRFDVSIGSITITKEREKTFDFTVPYYYTQGQVIVKQGSPLLTSLAAMKGKTIGVSLDTTYSTFLQKAGGINVKQYDTDADTFPDLKNGRLDGVMTADLTASQAIASGYPFVFSGKPYYYEPLGFFVRKGEPDWLALLNYAVKKMHADGSLSAMAKKWYHGFDPTQAPAPGVPSYDEALAKLK